MPAVIAFAAAFPLRISTPRATPEILAAHGRGRGARRMDGTSTEQSTEHRRNNGTSTEHRITYERAPPRTRGGRGPEGTGKALKPPQPKRKIKLEGHLGPHGEASAHHPREGRAGVRTSFPASKSLDQGLIESRSTHQSPPKRH